MNALCFSCDTFHECPHEHKPPRPCTAYVWDGSYTTEEEAQMEDND